jgi:predicted O-methyltransferase YrrM
MNIPKFFKGVENKNNIIDKDRKITHIITTQKEEDTLRNAKKIFNKYGYEAKLDKLGKDEK